MTHFLENIIAKINRASTKKKKKKDCYAKLCVQDC